jgi:subtilisin family serine protease
MKTLKIPINTNASRLTVLLLILNVNLLWSQNSVYPYFYRVYFKDKGTQIPGSYSASSLLSPRAIARRQKSGIPYPDLRDIPVNKTYINGIVLKGLKLHSTSKWMNTALFKSQTAIDLNLIRNLPYVSTVKIVRSPATKGTVNTKLDFKVSQASVTSFDRPITMLNGAGLHKSGYDGNSKFIAILDGGFLNSDVITSLADLRARKGIKYTFDFVNNTESVYNASTHGTAVLSVLAGSLTGIIEGTAPGADFILVKTEDVESEYPCEEDFWAAGAELADSMGVDLISSSLGYFTFDDPALNYKVSDLDGNTAFITRVADIAASKGILVVNSAGNERTNAWRKIIFPSDADSVLAAGAVDENELIAGFSSAGPSADGRIKPDNVAMGVNVTVQTAQNLVGTASGTSFSCPVLSGMAACLMQGVPAATNMDIIEALHSSSDRYSSPDSLYGYGIPDLMLAFEKLQDKYLKRPDGPILIYPNPTSGKFKIIFSSSPQILKIEIFTSTGKLISSRNYNSFPGRSIDINIPDYTPEGIYLLRVTDIKGVTTRKVIKTRNSK